MSRHDAFETELLLITAQCLTENLSSTFKWKVTTVLYRCKSTLLFSQSTYKNLTLWMLTRGHHPDSFQCKSLKI